MINKFPYKIGLKIFSMGEATPVAKSPRRSQIITTAYLLSVLALGRQGADVGPAQLLHYLHHGLGLHITRLSQPLVQTFMCKRGESVKQ